MNRSNGIRKMRGQELRGVTPEQQLANGPAAKPAPVEKVREKHDVASNPVKVVEKKAPAKPKGEKPPPPAAYATSGTSATERIAWITSRKVHAAGIGESEWVIQHVSVAVPGLSFRYASLESWSRRSILNGNPHRIGLGFAFPSRVGKL
jgi:hypothetical protein